MSSQNSRMNSTDASSALSSNNGVSKSSQWTTPPVALMKVAIPPSTQPLSNYMQSPIYSHPLAKPQLSPLLIQSQLEKLEYEVTQWSSYSAHYHPKNIMENKPTDQASRWSSGSNNQMQYLILKLNKPSIVHTILFGKYHKVHVCNLKEFKVFGGLSPNHMTEILHSGLRNDNEPETFPLKSKTNDVVFPCQYLKIVPIAAWGANFNFSIWCVEIRGISDSKVVQPAYDDFIRYRETEAVKLCLKHFRQRNLMEAFHSLQQKAKVDLEHPMLSQLHQEMVVHANFHAAESIIEQAASYQLFDEYISESMYRPVWKRINATDPNGDMPCMRGGHQMCIDVECGLIYMFGGWNGSRDLSDFWVYSINNEQWTCVSQDTRKQGGPSPRSCHKICFDAKQKQIYVLGRYIDPQSRPGAVCDSDFYRFDATSQQWYRISENTFLNNGPELIYDHQMAIDSERQILYIFGGRIINSSTSASPESSYSGLYAYDIVNNAWKLLRSDMATTEGSVPLRSRIGHSMLFNQDNRQLYIFAGQRHKDYLSDFYVYDIANDRVTEMSRDYSKNGGPEAGFTQRATIDITLKEFYVFSGLMREKNSTSETVNNSFWSYSITKDRWCRIYHNENTGEAYWKEMNSVEPCPRFAHQLVYDHVARVQYLFGGNPGEQSNMSLRLDDFWSLRLLKPSPEDILRRARFMIRQQQFKELCRVGDSMEALKFLQTQLGSCVNTQDPKEDIEFRNLTTTLFTPQADTTHDSFASRTALYEHLLEFFPECMKQPKDNLIDLVKV